MKSKSKACLDELYKKGCWSTYCIPYMSIYESSLTFYVFKYIIFNSNKQSTYNTIIWKPNICITCVYNLILTNNTLMYSVLKYYIYTVIYI